MLRTYIGWKSEHVSITQLLFQSRPLNLVFAEGQTKLDVCKKLMVFRSALEPCVVCKSKKLISLARLHLSEPCHPQAI